MENRYTAQQIYDKAGRLTLYSPYANNLRLIVACALSHAPNEVVDYIIDNCCVHSLEPDMKGMYIPRRYLGDRDMIFLCSEVYGGYMDDHIQPILHECAHCWLKHKSRFDGITLDEQDKQEEEVAALVDNWQLDSLGH